MTNGGPAPAGWVQARRGRRPAWCLLGTGLGAGRRQRPRKGGSVSAGDTRSTLRNKCYYSFSGVKSPGILVIRRLLIAIRKGPTGLASPQGRKLEAPLCGAQLLPWGWGGLWGRSCRPRPTDAGAGAGSLPIAGLFFLVACLSSFLSFLSLSHSHSHSYSLSSLSLSLSTVFTLSGQVHSTTELKALSPHARPDPADTRPALLSTSVTEGAHATVDEPAAAGAASRSPQRTGGLTLCVVRSAGLGTCVTTCPRRSVTATLP